MTKQSEKRQTMPTTAETQQEKEYPPITIENLHKTASAAATNTIEVLYYGQPRKVKSNSGYTVNYDGNSGGDPKMQELIDSIKSSSTLRNKPNENGVLTLNEIGNDYDDCVSVASLALWENMVRNGGERCDDDGFSEACSAVRRYIYQQESNTAVKVRRKYDRNGNVLAVDDYKYTKYPHMYINRMTEIDEDGNETQFDIVDVNDELAKYIDGQITHEFITELMKVLTASQKEILHYMALGWMNTTICKRLDIAPSTLRVQIMYIREKAVKLAKKLDK